MEKVAMGIERIMERYNYNRFNRISVKGAAAVIGCWILFAEAVFMLANRWDNVNRRFAAVEDINLWLICSNVRTYLLFYRRSVYVIVGTIHDTYPSYGSKSQNKEAIFSHHDQRISYQLKIVRFVLITLQTNLILLPCCQTLYRMVSNVESFSSDDLVLPFEFWHITSNYVGICAVLIFQIIFSQVAIEVSASIYLTLLGTVHRITLEIQLLNIAINETDRFSTDDSGGIDEKLLRIYMIKLINHHSYIYRLIRVCNKEIGWFALCLTQAICCQLCLLFYWVVEVDDNVVFQIRDGSQVFALIVYIYSYSALGQTVMDECDTLRDMLYRSSWVDKPVWFKKSLINMMTMSTRTYQIKPYGLFTIGFNNFTKIMNGAYTYFNVLRTFKATP